MITTVAGGTVRVCDICERLKEFRQSDPQHKVVFLSPFNLYRSLDLCVLCMNEIEEFVKGKIQENVRKNHDD